jgi:chromosome partitioning protein
MIISILNEKGGVGKTTLAVNLAHAMKLLDYRTLLVDSDSQGSARDWHARNNGELINMVALDRPTICNDIRPMKNLYDRIIIDGSGWGSVDNKSVEMAVKTIVCSDLVLIPLQPSPYDFWASKNIIELIKMRKIVNEGSPKAAFVLNQCIKNTKIMDQVLALIKEFDAGIHLFDQEICKRVVYATSAFAGNTVMNSDDKNAKKEFINLVNEIEEYMK